MAKHLKLFQAHSEYSAFINTEDFIKPNVSYCVSENEVHYNPIPDYSKMYFTVEAVESGDFSLYYDYETPGAGVIPTMEYLEYSKDGQNWTRIVPVENQLVTSDSIHLNVGENVMVRGINDGLVSYGWYIWIKRAFFNFSSDGTPKKYNAYGNMMSLLYGDNFENNTDISTNTIGVFGGIFKGGQIVDAQNLVLSATILSARCYEEMFKNCTNLVNAPKSIPATTLATECCNNMFQNCTSLTTAPELPAETLAYGCYSSMFESCTSLTTAPSVLPATTLESNCYSNMFENCTSLTIAPELPATRLIDSCYNRMFNICASLNYIKCLATDISASYCTFAWVNGVSASGTFVKAASMTDWTNGIDGIPNGWTVETASE